MIDLLFAVVAYSVCQVALFGLALLAYVHWGVPVRDLAVLLRECKPAFPRRGRPWLAVREKASLSGTDPMNSSALDGSRKRR
jgi:hypothetical protein